AYIVDSTGKRYLDASGGAAVSCLGHSNTRVIGAIQTQLDRLAFAHTGFFSSEPAEALAELLINHAPGRLDRVYVVSGGSEAVEAAIKLARQYCIESGQSSRHRVIARQQSYHGNTLGALAAGGNMWRREPFAPLMIDTTHISPCYAYRGQQDGESEFDYGQRVANELETEILRLGADQVMAFIAEPVVGATLGAVPPVEGYYKRIREICDQYGVLLILDEVMCGMGRTGSLFACEQDGIAPDIMTIAKGLGAGYQAIGAMLCTDTIYQAIEQGSGFFQHGHTYIGHPTACAGAHAVVSEIIDRNLVARVQQQSVQLRAALQDRFGEHPNVGDIRGRGLFIGLEFVSERDGKMPFRAQQGMNKKFKQAAFDGGLICYPMGGTIDGRQGDHVLLAPPFIIEDSHISEIVDKLDQALTTTLANL
ncbi:aspartate aminotransferase family protein, partial [Gammaproteobacteria bacterium]|nr:aspartate aminotransferase family protein [Gammaproteobacteria bacterium]